ncbi:DUF6300 family protein [Streptomyces sp. NPDC058739]|uniref:DUF6300 family protein n=1 Tax=Streptomyces sp. NPDC058739 TaxID=3346618 RepID=UPI003689A3D3
MPNPYPTVQTHCRAPSRVCRPPVAYAAGTTGGAMELCPACDARRPAARAFIQWHRDADRDPKALPSSSRTGRPRPCTPTAGHVPRNPKRHPAHRPTCALSPADTADVRRICTAWNGAARPVPRLRRGAGARRRTTPRPGQLRKRL